MVWVPASGTEYDNFVEEGLRIRLSCPAVTFFLMLLNEYHKHVVCSDWFDVFVKELFLCSSYENTVVEAVVLC